MPGKDKSCLVADTKTKEAIILWKTGEKLKALSLIRNFRIGVTKQQRGTMEIAYEMQTSGSSIYSNMGYDKDEQLSKAYYVVSSLIKKWSS